MLLHLIPQLWVIVRVWLDKQTAEAYALAFRKIFNHCSQSSKTCTFEVGKTLLGVVIDWSDACRGCWSQFGSRRA